MSDFIASMDTQLSQFVSQLRQGNLPGRAAQRQYSPSWAYGRHFTSTPLRHHKAAVMLLLYRDADRWWLPLTKRPSTLPDHPGQISLPGGRIEPGESSLEAAIRELNEELGIAVEPTAVIGQLSPLFVYSSRHQVTPWVACVERKPLWVPAADEVERVIEVPVAKLMEMKSPQTSFLKRGEASLRFPAWLFADETVWGATAMILNEFRWLWGAEAES